MRCKEKRTRGGEGGFTLVETTVATAISSLIVGGLVVMLFQFTGLARMHQDSLTVSHDLESAMSLLNHDVVSATDSEVAGQNLTLTIPHYEFGVSGSPVTDTVTYSYEAATGLLHRADTEAGTGVVVARHLSSLSFMASDALVTVTMTSDIRGQQETASLVMQQRPAE